jgi:hypothetical protein
VKWAKAILTRKVDTASFAPVSEKLGYLGKELYGQLALLTKLYSFKLNILHFSNLKKSIFLVFVYKMNI